MCVLWARAMLEVDARGHPFEERGVEPGALCLGDRAAVDGRCDRGVPAGDERGDQAG
jgi:hypothetical protein